MRCWRDDLNLQLYMRTKGTSLRFLPRASIALGQKSFSGRAAAVQEPTSLT
jgi:hypothetical protein